MPGDALFPSPAHSPALPPAGRPLSRFLWLASYPKSGNTWMRLALDSLRRGGAAVDINVFGAEEEAISSSRFHFDLAAAIDSGDLLPDEILAARPAVFRVLAGILPDGLCWKVHEACLTETGAGPLFPPDVTRAAIHIVRDPRDVAVSFAAHQGHSIDSVIALMADPEAMLSAGRSGGKRQVSQPLRTWSGHAVSWMDQTLYPVITVRYEEMLADLAAVLRRVIPLLGPEGEACSEAAVAGAVEATRFATLRGQEVQAGFRERPPEAAVFFRQGTSGGWRDGLTARQVARIEADHGPVMERLGYL
ncbi:sulfotransferase domain-containing protein [Novispirillum itersonii]|uniref:Aryl sulfotransferase n=1 Tax=Novispirillum itersonii TaxID=189 RepID=A0A7W9ZF50_NOVIT|nr:sulfotransferase domain-containing protein [Novispirillum itersonii]MBB6210352.1 aryl sulfotransferase [Novispirillum itersonii]